MGKLSMKRVEIAAPLSERKRIMETLQRRGVVELKDCTGDGLLKMKTAESMSLFDKACGEAMAARVVLTEYLPAEKKSMFSGFSSNMRAMESADFDEQVLKAEKILVKCHYVNNLHAAVKEAYAEIARLQTKTDQLHPWEALDIPMDFAGTEACAVFIGSVPYHCSAGDIMEKLACDSAEVEVVSAFPELSNLFVICYKEDADQAYRALRGIGFSKPGDPPHCLPAEQMALHEKDMIRLRGEIKTNEDAIRACRGMEGEIEFLIDYYGMRKDKYEALGSLGMTGNAFVAEGYIPEKYVQPCGRA